ncbi:hypothetical protein CDD83_4471 [Cordyceps sp. RAO-2017]|nr:hypothetical protein CDD83_4471 [Cordyceps sp. RAO-2017]
MTLLTCNHGASIARAAFLAPGRAFALSHDERFALYGLDLPDPGAAAEPAPTIPFGDLRAGLGCQYVAGVTPKTDGSGAVIGAGAQDRQTFELVFLASDPSGQSWALDKANGVGLPGAHGGDIVRAFCFFDDQQLVFTAGEDGNIKAWRPGG